MTGWRKEQLQVVKCSTKIQIFVFESEKEGNFKNETTYLNIHKQLSKTWDSRNKKYSWILPFHHEKTVTNILFNETEWTNGILVWTIT